MDKKTVIDVLAAHADHLIDPRSGPPKRLTRNEQVQGLLDLAEELQGILVPVAPDTHFRRRLHGDLILQAQRRENEPQASLLRQHRTGILIGAAAVGSVASVVGVVIAFFLRHRHGGITRAAGS
jgi:hypothetical protein